MTTAALIALVRSLWGQTTANSGGILDTEIVDYLNMRQRELCADSDVLVSAWTASTVLAQQQYSVPPEYTSVEAVRIYRTTGDQKKEWLAKVDITQIDAMKTAGSPVQFARWGLNVGGNNSPAFWLDPIPDANGTNDLECYGRQLPAAMVSGGQAPEVRDRWQDAIARGALADVFLRLAPGKPEYFALADRAQARWKADKDAAAEETLLDVYHPAIAKNTMGY